MIFASITIGIFRRWQARKKIIALVIQSHGEHTETAVLRDDSGSAYQIALHAAGLYFRPSLTISEYIPDTMRVVNQRSFFTTIFMLRRDLDCALDQVVAWMDENHAKRLPEDEEMKLVQEMFAKSQDAQQVARANATIR